MGGHSPKTLGTTAHAIDEGTLVRQSSPQPGVLRKTAAQPRPASLHTLVFDGQKLDRFFRSVAYSVTLASHLSIKPMQADPQHDSWGVRAIIAVMPKKYLPEEVDLPMPQEIEPEVKAAANDYGEQFWYELDKGGARAVQEFLRDLEGQRQRALESTQKVFQEAAQHNSEAESVGNSIATSLCVVKFASTIVVAGISLPVVAAATGMAAVGGAAAFGIGAGYSVSLQLIKEWSKGSNAELVAVTTESLVDSGKEEGANRAADAFKEGYKSEAQNAKAAARKIEWLEKRVKQGGSGRDARRLAGAKDALKSANNAKWLARGMAAVPYLFFAWSAKEAWNTFQEDMHQSR